MVRMRRDSRCELQMRLILEKPGKRFQNAGVFQQDLAQIKLCLSHAKHQCCSDIQQCVRQYYTRSRHNGWSMDWMRSESVLVTDWCQYWYSLVSIPIFRHFSSSLLSCAWEFSSFFFSFIISVLNQLLQKMLKDKQPPRQDVIFCPGHAMRPGIVLRFVSVFQQVLHLSSQLFIIMFLWKRNASEKWWLISSVLVWEQQSLSLMRLVSSDSEP